MTTANPDSAALRGRGHDDGDPIPAVHRGQRRLRRSRWLRILGLLATVAVVLTLLVEVVVPGYMRPTTRTYGTRLGYPALLRRLGKPLPVETATATNQTIVRSFLGEGTMASDPVLVPMVPVGKITAVYVNPGQRVHKGDLLAELDARKGQVTAEAARLAFLNAKAELRRVRIGSVVVLNREQPGQSAIDVQSLRKQLDILRDETEMKDRLYEQGLVSRDKLLEEKRILAEAEQSLETATLSLEMASSGKGESERIAENTLQQAVLDWQEKLEELNEYKIVAPADGIIDRVLVHAGEYNHDEGSPAFVLAAGLWFEAYFDQSAVGEVVEGAPAEVHLAARPDETFVGRVANVNPIVTYGTGGPDTTRPIQPIGNGAPEWPETFRARIELASTASGALVPGLTGFAHVKVERAAVTVPQAAMISMSSGSGLLFIVHGSQWQVRDARYGTSFNGALEVLAGAVEGDKVIVAGQRVLEPGDAIKEQPWSPSVRP
jgi:multidrug resistance efflux pump